MCQGICVCHCFGDTPIDRSLPCFKSARLVGYEFLAQIIRNWDADSLVHDRSDVDEGEGSAQQLFVILERVTQALPVAYDTAGTLVTANNRKQRDRESCTICHHCSSS